MPPPHFTQVITCPRLYFWNFSRCARLICVPHAVKTAAAVPAIFEPHQILRPRVRRRHGSILQGGRGTGEIRRTGESGQGAAALQQLRNKYQMRCARAQGNTKMREDYNKWRDTAQKAMVKYQVGRCPSSSLRNAFKFHRKQTGRAEDISPVRPACSTLNHVQTKNKPEPALIQEQVRVCW